MMGRLLFVFVILLVSIQGQGISRQRPHRQQDDSIRKNVVSGEVHTNCFLNDFGLKCCNRELLRLMVSSLRSMNYSPCNMQAPANDLQRNAQVHFNQSFESFVAPDQVALNGRYRGGLMCKVRTPYGKVAVLYAGVVPYTVTGQVRPLTQHEIEQMNWSPEENRIDSF